MRKLTIIVGVIVLCASTLAQAATSTGNMVVSAIVTSTCSLQSAALMLGNNSTATRQQPQVGVNCSTGTAYTVSWDNNGGAATLNNTGNGNQQSLPLSGVVPTSQNLSTGNFNDVVAITLSY